MPANMTASQDVARRALLTEAANDDLTAARKALGKLTAYAVQLASQLALAEGVW